MVGASLSTGEVILRIVLAAILGGVVGLERERDGQEAGFRTHMLLATGAGLFGLISIGAFDDFGARQADTNFIIDPTRIASYVAVAVGFLGAGVIVRHVGRVSGLTTAASIWATTAIGLAAGLGFWDAALATTVVVLISLVALRPVSRLAGRIAAPAGARVVILLAPGASAAPLVAELDRLGDDRRRIEVGEGAPGQTEIRADFRELDAQALRAAVGALADRGDVASLVIGPRTRP